MVEAERAQNPWVSTEQNLGVLTSGNDLSMREPVVGESGCPRQKAGFLADGELGIGERGLSAVGAAFLSAIIVNPLDVVKTRLQAQAAGVAYSHPLSNITSRMTYFGPNMMFADLRCSPSCSHAGVHGTVSICPPPDCFHYKGTLDVFHKIIRQVGIYLPCYDLFRNWLEDLTSQYLPGTTLYAPLVAGSLARSLACVTCYPIELARTRMQAFKAAQVGRTPPGVLQTLLDVISNVRSTNNPLNNLKGYRILWTGMGAQLARDVPFSAICWPTLEPIRRRLLILVGDESNVAAIFGANFSAGFIAGSLAAVTTCPLDVAKTRRQIENDPIRALRMTTRQVLTENLEVLFKQNSSVFHSILPLMCFLDGGLKGLFMGVGPRVGRAGPSVGIVVSFYEVVKYALHHRHLSSHLLGL
ncbi:hypothetical protein K2173_011827 [Erythroxylum novogranatense]|uniref:Mitochondrial carrier protein n=1 Tax=Erythroxylum novogranatense TaxID=1862640 RepID=A0AAV8SM35_9ROSI|nr:hypothetical protein K2173_011827 [Erythroxylum novogranatense]